MLLVSAAIGVYSALSGGRQKTANEFLLGNRNMGIIPVSMSIMVSFISAISVIGTPGEIYMYDTMFLWGVIAYILPNLLLVRLFMPLFFKLNITSVYEYLELRYNRAVRSCGTAIFSIQTLIYMGIAMYTPALAINAVTGMDLWACVISTGGVCIFYTAVGGIKAVLWTDTLQALIIVIGVVAVIIKGTIEVGGADEVWRIGLEGRRLVFNNFSFDPRVRYTAWGMIFGMGTLNLTLGINQTIVQRILSTGSKRRAVMAIVLATVGKMIIVSLCVFSGVVMYTYYVDCDPFTMGYVKSKDQLMPFFVMEMFEDMPGLPGIFLSAVVSASISTLSSGVNSLAAVTGEDVIKVLWPNMAPSRYAMVTKLLAVLFGLLSIGSAFVASILGEGVLSLALSLAGISYGGLLGVFLQGIYSRRANSKGALSGLVSSVLFVGWIRIGAMVYPSVTGKNVLSVDGCPVYNTSETAMINSTTILYASDISPLYTTTQSVPMEHSEDPPVAELYHISFLYYAPIGVIISVIVGTIVSTITGSNETEKRDLKLMSDFPDAVCCCFSEPIKQTLRCGNERIVDVGEDEIDVAGDTDDEEEIVTDMKYIKMSGKGFANGDTATYERMLPKKEPDVWIKRGTDV
ncbi:sodium-coupled monocarboxylate transporter 1-like [Diadema setosum]|uniref:sodium-coupled monocarboxylate transporter 1-like n=1 Tax=Diadema setosum TaxID=31175 RepID=UPI003B3A86A2